MKSTIQSHEIDKGFSELMVLVLSQLGVGMSGEDNEVSLRVAKAIPSDVGHGRARISGEHGLDLKPGDIVEIKGEKRSTAANPFSFPSVALQT